MTTPQAPLPQFATVPDALAAHAAQRPDSPALSAGDEQLAYRDLAGLVGHLAARLAGLGVRSGDRVAILGINSIEWIVAFLATLELGAVAVPLNHRLGRAELAHQLELIRARVVLHDAALSEPCTPCRGHGGHPHARSGSRRPGLDLARISCAGT